MGGMMCCGEKRTPVSGSEKKKTTTVATVGT